MPIVGPSPPPSTSSIGARTLAMAFADARAIGLLNDLHSRRFPDSVLLPHAAYVIGEIQDEFALHSLPLVETITESLTYAANDTSIVVPAGVTDLAAPLEIWEKGASDEKWVPMVRNGNLRPPLETSRDRLYEWEWRNGTIAVLACSTARDIFCRYRRQLAYPGNDATATTMGFDGIYFAVVAGTAFYAATTMPAVQAKAGVMYTKRLQSAVLVASRDLQVVDVQQVSAAQRGYSNLRVVSS